MGTSRLVSSTCDKGTWTSQTLEFQETSSQTKEECLSQAVETDSNHKYVKDSSPVETDHLTMQLASYARESHSPGVVCEFLGRGGRRHALGEGLEVLREHVETVRLTSLTRAVRLIC